MLTMAKILILLFLVGITTLSAKAVPVRDHPSSSNHQVGIFGNASYSFEDILRDLVDNVDELPEDAKGQEESACTGLPCFATSAYGGSGGGPFADNCSTVVGIREIMLSVYLEGGTPILIKSMQVKYVLSNLSEALAPEHGNVLGGQAHTISFGTDEQIVAVVGRADDSRLRQLTFITRALYGVKNVFGPYGSSTLGDMFVVNADVISFFGRSGADIDSLGFFYR